MYDMAELAYTLTTVPANSQYLVVWDSSRIGDLPASAASEPAPGTDRGRFAGMRVNLTIKNGDQDVTVAFRAMTNPSLATNSAFETDTNGPGGGSVTLAANATGMYSWLPFTNDHRVYVLAGANNPDSLVTTVNIVRDRNAGV